jgi:hypothetical protein
MPLQAHQHVLTALELYGKAQGKANCFTEGETFALF